MNITTLSLQHFRNFKEVEEIEFPDQGLLVAAAPNAVGKTNFLESIYYILRGKSFRAQAGECVQWGADFFSIKAKIRHLSGESHLSATYDRLQKTLSLQENGTPASLATFYAHYPFVLFLPEDTFMFARGPAARRNFLNTILATVPTYFSTLVQYHRVLRQRNAALKQAKGPGEVGVWNVLLVEHATFLWNQRNLFTAFLSTQLPQIYSRLSGDEKEIEIRLIPGVSDTNQFLQILENAFSQEARYKYTLYGPHRDDMAIWIDGHQVQTALSRGQMRLLIVSLKIVAYQYIKQVTGEEPLLLLDEILSELDEERQHTLLDNLPLSQVLMTCTKLPKQLKGRAGVHMIDLRTILKPAEAVAPEMVAVAA